MFFIEANLKLFSFQSKKNSAKIKSHARKTKDANDNDGRKDNRYKIKKKEN
jgi:hypothetical protein